MTPSTEIGRSPIARVTPLFADRRQRTPAPSRPHTTCVIATVPRSGSWLLAELLWNTGHVGEPHEYFRPDFTDLWAAEWALPRQPDISSYIAAAMSWTQTPNGVFAAKIHWYQLVWLTNVIAADSGLTPGAVVDLADWLPSPRYVLLRRRDTARQAISYFRAATTGVWYATEGERPWDSGGDAFRQDLQQIRWFEDALIDHEAQWRRYLRTCGATPLEVCYEDMAADRCGTVRRVLDFLNLPHAETPTLTPRLRTQSDASTDRILHRYLAVRDELEPRPADMEWREDIRRFVRASPAFPASQVSHADHRHRHSAQAEQGPSTIARSAP